MKEGQIIRAAGVCVCAVIVAVGRRGGNRLQQFAHNGHCYCWRRRGHSGGGGGRKQKGSRDNEVEEEDDNKAEFFVNNYTFRTNIACERSC